jgi:queuosine precursor transporter
MDTRLNNTRFFPVVSMVFVACLLIANTLAAKIIEVGGFVLPAGILTFPISYIFSDILVECYGFAASRVAIWTGFACQIMMSFFYWLSVNLPPASFWHGQEQWSQFFSLSPRIALASLLAYLVGEFLNSVVLSRLKLRTQGKHLWMRTIGSTVIGQGADSIIFNFTAFAGIYTFSNVLYIAFSGYVLKCLYEILATPLTYGIVGYLKRVEGFDHYDYGVRYSVFGPTHRS